MKWPPNWPPRRPKGKPRMEQEDQELIRHLRDRLQEVQTRLDALRAEAESNVPERKT